MNFLTPPSYFYENSSHFIESRRNYSMAEICKSGYFFTSKTFLCCCCCGWRSNKTSVGDMSVENFVNQRHPLFSALPRNQLETLVWRSNFFKLMLLRFKNMKFYYLGNKKQLLYFTRSVAKWLMDKLDFWTRFLRV